jgi:WXG100 family type VII secretion target
MALGAGAVGADIHKLLDLAKTYTDQATQLNALITKLDGETTSSRDFWQGVFSDNFRNDWDNTAKPAFQKFVDALNQASTDLKKNADNIAQVTGAK